jgi:hypothetical protein
MKAEWNRPLRKAKELVPFDVREDDQVLTERSLGSWFLPRADLKALSSSAQNARQDATRETP